MSKIGKNKKRCEHYRTSGNLQTNKLLKQEHNEKLIAKFVARHATGKSYKYKPNPFEKGSDRYIIEAKHRTEKNVDRRLPLQKLTSIIRKLNNQLAKEMSEMKLRKERKKTRGTDII